MKSQKSLIKIAMGCDERIPAKAMGYIADLSAEASPEMVEDRLKQLARYVPDLVEKYRSAQIGRGGPGRGQGIRAADGATGLKRTNITIDPASADALRAFGDGDLSLGIRRAAAHIKKPSK